MSNEENENENEHGAKKSEKKRRMIESLVISYQFVSRTSIINYQTPI
jgi:hypothetical protein